MKKTFIACLLAASGIFAFSGCASASPVGTVLHVYPPGASETDGHYSVELDVNSSGGYSYGTGTMYECANAEECQNLLPKQRITYAFEGWTHRLINVRVAVDTPANR